MERLSLLLLSIAMQVLVIVYLAEGFTVEDDKLPLAYTLEYGAEANPTSLPSTEAHLPGMNRRLAEKAKLICNKYPQICRNRGSPGPDCCSKQCVDVMTDRLNCGMCGYKCKRNEACCGGRCVNLLKDEKNCGSCNKKCNKGDDCMYGLCNYA